MQKVKYGYAGNGYTGHGYMGSGYTGKGYAGKGYAGGGCSSGSGYAGHGYEGSGYRSPGYASGYVAGLSKGLLDRGAVERIAGSQTPEEAVKLLAEFGWGDVRDAESVQTLTVEKVNAACALVRLLSPDPKITECFLLKYDILNVKTLLKGKSLGVSGEALSACGTIPAEKLRKAIQTGDTRDLPDELAEELRKLEAQNALSFDPLATDAALDQLLYRMIFERLGRRASVEREYFEDVVDLTNLMILLRARGIGWDEATLARMFIEGGSLSRQALLSVFREAGRADRVLVGKRYASAFLAGLGAHLRGGDLAALEKRVDDYLTAQLRVYRYVPMSILPLIGYLIAVEREAACVRLVLTAKAARVPKERLLERLRELYA